MHKYVYEVIDAAKAAKTKKEKIEILRKNESWALKDVLKGTLDNNVVWLLPSGPVPYTASEEHNAPINLLNENKQFTYFVKGGKGERVTPIKRESMFLGLLEGIHPQDAAYVADMINKKPFKGGLTSRLVNEAFPGLISE